MLENKIAELRKEKNLSQEQLAEILNTSRQAVSKWERGEAYPDIDRLKELAIYFGVSIDYLLDYDIESLTLSNYLERLKKVGVDSTFDITIDELKSMIAKNSNHFELLISSVNYLFAYWSKYHEHELLDLIIKYCKKVLTIYDKNNELNIKIDDIKIMIATIYQIKNDFEQAKAYLKGVEGIKRDILFADCEMALGNYESAGCALNETFFESFASLVNSNILQIRLYLKMNEVKEAYNLSIWTISFIKSIGKSDDEFIDLLYIITFCKACAEKNLNLDWQESVHFLKENRPVSKDPNTLRSVELKLFNEKKVNYYNTFEDDIQTALWKEIALSKGSLVYNDLVETYNYIFGEEDHE
ncbi:MAG: helix-turn-helix transcriptional regulator [Bacilli bacterium]|nr:helix-turn-helix transcriptional regulator [Bacilli bacterium]